MRIGVGLPTAVDGIDRQSLIAWARGAEDAGFASLAAVDRLTFVNLEPLLALSAAAVVTESIELLTDVVLAPLHANTAMLAKQTATLDQLSQGRLTLGLGIGGVPEDFEMSGLNYRTRGRTFEAQLKTLRMLWEKAISRTGQRGTGGAWSVRWAPSADPRRRPRRPGLSTRSAPRLTATLYFSLDATSTRRADSNLSRLYNAASPEAREWVLRSLARGADAIMDMIEAYEQAGANDVICVPTSTDLTQLEELAAITL